MSEGGEGGREKVRDEWGREGRSGQVFNSTHTTCT